MTQDNRVSDEMEFFHSHFLQRAHVTDDTIYLSDLAKFEQLISKVRALEAEIQKVVEKLKEGYTNFETVEGDEAGYSYDNVSNAIKKLEALAVVKEK